MDVIYPDDVSYIDFQKEAICQTAFYILIWSKQTPADENRYVYIGQTGNGGERIKQHIRAGRRFECACVFTSLDREFTRTDVMFMEYVSIVHIIEQGSANLMDNCQIPQQPVVRSEDLSWLADIFITIQKLTAFAGYHVFARKKFISSNDIGKRRNLAKRLTEQYLKMDKRSYEKDINSISDNESEVMIKYIASGSNWKAECIPVNDKFFIMPNSTVDTTTIPMMAYEDSVIQKNGEYVDYVNRTIPRGMTVDSLEEAAGIVCGCLDASIWKIVRTIV